jgi:hypothetical protein
MGKFAATYAPKSASGGINDNQQNILTAASTATVTLGLRQIVRMSVAGVTPAATGLVAVRFSLSTKGATTAVATDFQLPAGVFDFELGDEYDTINLYGVAGCVVCIMRLAN